MDPVLIMNIIAAAAQTLRSVAPMIPEAAAALGATDAGKLKDLLAEIQRHGDENHAIVQAKLRGA